MGVFHADTVFKNGLYKAAIRFDPYTWYHPKDYATEAEALENAEKTLADLYVWTESFLRFNHYFRDRIAPTVGEESKEG